MARISSAKVFFVILSVACLFQANTAFLDFLYFENQLIKVIKEHNLNCTNYNEFCGKSFEQFQNTVDPTETNANEMGIELCKVILKVYLCESTEKATETKS